MLNPLTYYNTRAGNVVLPDNEQSITATIPFVLNRPIGSNAAMVTTIPPLSVTLIRRSSNSYTVRFNALPATKPFTNPVGDVNIVRNNGVIAMFNARIPDYKVSIIRLTLNNGVSAQFLQLETMANGVMLIYVFALPISNLASLTSISINNRTFPPEAVTRLVFPATNPVTF